MNIKRLVYRDYRDTVRNIPYLSRYAYHPCPTIIASEHDKVSYKRISD